MPMVKSITYSVTTVGTPIVTVEVDGPIPKLFFNSFSMDVIRKGLDLRRIKIEKPVKAVFTEEFRSLLNAGGCTRPVLPILEAAV